MDVILRLEPLAHEMERTREPIVIIGHQGIHRILYAYFMGLSREEAPYVSIPLNTIIQLTPHAYGCHEKRLVTSFFILFSCSCSCSCCSRYACSYAEFAS